MLETLDNKEFLKIDEGAQVWCVFDRDKEINDRKDTSFSDSIIMAQAKGFRTAWSNDDFELWILLHFEDVEPTNDEYRKRSKYYERLTEVFKSFPSNGPLFDRVISNPRFNYYQSMKNRNRFIIITWQYMKANTQQAINRAEVLEHFYSDTSIALHDKSPCTMVHHLVKELMSKGKNELNS